MDQNVIYLTIFNIYSPIVNLYSNFDIQWLNKHKFPAKLYRVSQEECARLRENVPYVKVY